MKKDKKIKLEVVKDNFSTIEVRLHDTSIDNVFISEISLSELGEIYDSLDVRLKTLDFAYFCDNLNRFEDSVVEYIINKQNDVVESVCTCMAFHKSDECYKLGCKVHRSDEV